ncbi:MAG TPA: hypothetical protein DCO77_07090 [Nitrospiraceae bacterium]|nr:hypothetical protein [Nitrospiraceae bacterium]
MKKFVVAVLILLLTLTAVPAMAKTVFNLTGTQAEFKELSTELGLALSYYALAPAEPLGGGTLPHFDIGVEVTSVNINSNASYWTNNATDIPSALLVPRLHARLGIPFIAIDIGAVYSSVTDSDVKLSGAEVKWAILKGSTVTPAIALRGAYTKLSGVDALDLSTQSLDISISKGFAMLTPYAGIGKVWIDSSDTSGTLSKEKISETKSFVGLKFSLLPVFNIVAEAGFASANSYSMSLNLGF